MKRVLLVAPLPPPYGGISHWTAMIFKHSRIPGNTPLHIIDTAVRHRSLLETTFAHRVVLGIPSLIKQLYQVVLELAKGNVLAVHMTTSGVYAPVRDIAIILIARLFRRPSILHLRSGRMPESLNASNMRSRLLKFVLRHVSTVIAIDNETELSVRMAAPETSVTKIPNCINLSLLPSIASEKQKTVLFVGLVVPAKGIEDLLEAWSRILHSDWRLVVIGAYSDEYIKELRNHHKLDRVEFVGELDNRIVLTRMASSAVFCLPSHTEGFPNVILEAMALGCAIIATTVGAIPEMLSDGTGILVSAKDPTGLADKIEFLINNSNFRSQLANRAMTKVGKEYELAQIYKMYESIWHGTSQGKGASSDADT